MLNQSKLYILWVTALASYGESCGFHARKKDEQNNDMAFV